MLIELISSQSPKLYTEKKVFTDEECKSILILAKRHLTEHKSEHKRIKSCWLEYGIDSSWLYQKIINEVSQINTDSFSFNLTHVLEPISITEYFCSKSFEDIKQQYSNDDVRVYGLPRKLECHILLSNRFEGGELNILDGMFTPIQRTVGNAIVYPSHRYTELSPIKSGRQQVLTLSFFGPPFK